MSGTRRCSLVGSDGAAGSILVRRMGFTKLDEGILQSSVMAEDGNTFKIWITLLAACKEDGMARISPIFLSSICHIDIDCVLKSIEKLASPDPHSRSLNDDGRRLERIDGGYRIINYKKYRDYTYSGSKEAIKKRKQRERNINDLDGGSGTNTGHIPKVGGHSASASASGSGIQEGGMGETTFDVFWCIYPRKVGKGAAIKAWSKIDKQSETLELIKKALEWQKHSKQWSEDNGQFIPHPATYLNQRRWEDEKLTISNERLPVSQKPVSEMYK